MHWIVPQKAHLVAFLWDDQQAHRAPLTAQPIPQGGEDTTVLSSSQTSRESADF